jgi:hypothetical protein
VNGQEKETEVRSDVITGTWASSEIDFAIERMPFNTLIRRRLRPAVNVERSVCGRVSNLWCVRIVRRF